MDIKKSNINRKYLGNIKILNNQNEANSPLLHLKDAVELSGEKDTFRKKPLHYSAGDSSHGFISSGIYTNWLTDKQMGKNLISQNIKFSSTKDGELRANINYENLAEGLLLFDDLRYLAKLGVVITPLCIGAGAVGAATYAGLCTYSMVKSKNLTDKLDYATGIASSLEAGLYLGADKLGMGVGAEKLAGIIGFAAGIVEAGIGLRQICKGIDEDDKEKKIKGSFNIAIGSLWAAVSSVCPSPACYAAMVGVCAAKILYTGRKDIVKTINKYKNPLAENISSLPEATLLKKLNMNH